MGAKKIQRPDGVEEYKDKAKKHRMRHSESGRITTATPQGYHNKADMVDAVVNASVNQLVHYKGFIQPQHLSKLKRIVQELEAI